MQLPADVNQQLRRDTLALKAQRAEEYKEALADRVVGFVYQDNEEWVESPATDHKDIGVRLQPTKVQPQKPVNDALKFRAPTDEEALDRAVYDFYERNTTVQVIDGAELPEESTAGKLVIKDVKNVHISSEHQRAYIWSLISAADANESFETFQLWLSVYSLADCWSSPNAHTQELASKIERLRQGQDELDRLLDEKKKFQRVVQPEDAA